MCVVSCVCVRVKVKGKVKVSFNNCLWNKHLICLKKCQAIITIIRRKRERERERERDAKDVEVDEEYQ